ncbi:unnamed protein product [Didymodactylos carnosus]|uniref:Cyclic nucleotide-binding domain-containing protein n=1 Tax=Didymodactylos carnosus TaxID=1234261 RepID=A0A813R9K1_9BILA|nr:unnamed protein product [Didymodactylos carnosus]CAF0778009.1 unnamed protein product [Didymodactylos carnosus]CAF3509896.1 unnamed protein product [Didymodactylos carnosus]CAF3560812.1 unnamed protein product [Didymodactylos carnosus]
MALNYETLIRAAMKQPEDRTLTEVNDFIFPWLKASLKKKQGIFQKISDEVIHEICKSITLERRRPWEVVIRQGEVGDKFYIILQGSVNIYRLDDDAKPTTADTTSATIDPSVIADDEKREEVISNYFGNYIVTLGAGFDFGERALITDEPRSATVITATSTDLLVVERDVFNRTLKSAHEKELQEKTEFINKCPFFSTWNPRMKRLVSLNLERGHFSYDSLLFKQGERADAVYFIWSGEVKLTMDPLLHWLQYPNILSSHKLSKSDPLKSAAIELFLPMLTNLPNVNSSPYYSQKTEQQAKQQSYAIKRRHMTFAQAEQELKKRMLQVALLTTGDIIALEEYVCDLQTYMQTARCTSACDLFYILKHNLVRLQKRMGAQGLVEKLRETVLLTFHAYKQRFIYSSIPLVRLLTVELEKRNENDLMNNNYQQKRWFQLQQNTPKTSRRFQRVTNHQGTTRRTTTVLNRSFNSGTNPSHISSGDSMVSDQALRKLEERLKDWHQRMGQASKPQIAKLQRYNHMNTDTRQKMLARSHMSDSSHEVDDTTFETIDTQSDYLSNFQQSDEPLFKVELVLEENMGNIRTRIQSAPAVIYTKQQQYEDMKQYLKAAWKRFLSRPQPCL